MHEALRLAALATMIAFAVPAIIPTAVAYDATFTPTGSNEWWIQVKVSAASKPSSVHARVDGGTWQSLTLRSWGDWAASIHAPSGSIVQFRAKGSDGSADYSGCFQWTSRAATSCSATTTTSSTPTQTTTSTSSTTTTTTTTTSPSGTLLWKDSFAGSPWSAPWQIRSMWGSDRFDIVRESSSRAPTFLRVEYPEDVRGGGEFKATLGLSPRESIHMRYDVRFPVGFDFVRGGKLPGLYGGTGPSGGNIPDGTDGWSTRLMWRTGGAGEVYAYLPTSETWGTSLGRGSWSFAADGKWHRIEQKVILNSPGSSNGEVKIWYDGVQVLHKTGLKFRTTSTLKVDGIFFSTFFGGNDPSWFPPRNLHADFANFAVSSGYIG